MSKIIEVCVECSAVGYSEVVDIELPDDATEEDAQDAADVEFFNTCSYGWSWK